MTLRGLFAAVLLVVCPAVIGQAEERSWTFNGARSGDCELRTARLTIRSDGSATWDAVLFTHCTHGADIWHAQFKFNDANNRAAGGDLPNLNGWIDSPEMKGCPSGNYTWHEDMHFDQAAYNRMISEVHAFNC